MESIPHPVKGTAVNLHNPPALAIWPPRRRTLLDAQAGQDSTPAVTLSLLSDHSRAGACAAGRARPLLLLWPVGRRRVAGVALSAAGCAGIWAAVIAAGPLSRGAAVQVLFAAAMIIGALSESLLSPAVPVTTGDRARPGAAGRRKRLITCALVAGCLLGPAAGGAVLGAGWGTSLLTALAVACALVGIAAQRPPVIWHRSHRSPPSARLPVSPCSAAQADPIGGCAPPVGR